jgi:uncharacterized repeat protein (TIGR01451 family)
VLNNTATASATNEANTSNNSGSASITVLCPDLTVTKVPDTAAVSSTDVIGFTITVNNGGAGQAKNVMLTDTLPTNPGLSWSESPDNTQCMISGGALSCNFGTIHSGGSKSVHISSPTTANTCGTVSNTASASASNEANTGNNSGTGSVTVNCPDLKVEKVADPPPYNAGSPIGFTITVSNIGAGTAKNVNLSDPLPNNPGMTWSEAPDNTSCTISGTGVLTCNFGTMASGTTKFVHVTSPTTPANCGPVSNTATASASNEKANALANNTATASIVLADVTAPVINTNGLPMTLWSPNHKYVTYRPSDFVTSVSDSCQTSIPITAIYIWKVSSDEPENINSGDGNTTNDMVIANDCKSVNLRAERDGNKNGRVYTIYLRVKDANNNIATTTVKVTVPHSQGPRGAAVDDGPVYWVTGCP